MVISLMVISLMVISLMVISNHKLDLLLIGENSETACTESVALAGSWAIRSGV